jgi:hypothetical protein
MDFAPSRLQKQFKMKKVYVSDPASLLPLSGQMEAPVWTLAKIAFSYSFLILFKPLVEDFGLLFRQ